MRTAMQLLWGNVPVPPEANVLRPWTLEEVELVAERAREEMRDDAAKVADAIERRYLDDQGRYTPRSEPVRITAVRIRELRTKP